MSLAPPSDPALPPQIVEAFSQAIADELAKTDTILEFKAALGELTTAAENLGNLGRSLTPPPTPPTLPLPPLPPDSALSVQTALSEVVSDALTKTKEQIFSKFQEASGLLTKISEDVENLSKALLEKPNEPILPKSQAPDAPSSDWTMLLSTTILVVQMICSLFVSFIVLLGFVTPTQEYSWVFFVFTIISFMCALGITILFALARPPVNLKGEKFIFWASLVSLIALFGGYCTLFIHQLNPGQRDYQAWIIGISAMSPLMITLYPVFEQIVFPFFFQMWNRAFDYGQL